MRETWMALLASAVITVGLVASALPAAKLWPEAAVALNFGLLLPGLVLTARVSRYRAEQGIPWPAFATLLMLAAIIVHSASLAAPTIVEPSYAWGRPATLEIQHGNYVFTNALVFFVGASVTGIPWWAANLVLALVPFAGGAHPPAVRNVVAALGLALAVASWAPLVHQSLAVEADRFVHGLLWGYFLWAVLCSVLAGVLVLGPRAKRP